MRKSNTSTLATVVLTVFLDFIGISLVIPVAAPLFLSAQGTLFDAAATLGHRTLILGLLLGTAPLVEFFSAPLLGAWADRAGRKPVMLLSVLVNGFGHALTAISFLTGTLWLLFLARFLTGAGAGNLAACNSAIADVSTQEEKPRNFGLIGMSIGLGLIFGPFFGGKLSDPTLVSWFSYDTPLWVAAALAMLNACCVILFFRETLETPVHRPMNILTGARNLVRAFTMTNLRSLYAVSFLMAFGFNFFTQFFSVFLVARFQFNPSQIGALFAYIGIWIALTQGVLTRVLSRHYRPIQIVSWAPLGAVAVLIALARVQQVQTVYLLLPLAALFYGVNPPNVNTMVSEAAGRESQGEALGISQSMSALSFALPPIVSGVLIAITPAMPLIMAATFVGIAWIVFTRYRLRRVTAPVFHEV